MKIAMLTKHFNFRNGSSRVIQEITARLTARGDEVHIYCNRRPPSYAGGARLHHVPMIPLGAWARVMSFDYGCARRVGPAGFDLVHGHGNTASQDVVTIHNCRLANLRARGLPPSRWDPYLAMEARQLSNRRLRAVITLSGMVKRDLVRHYGVAPGRITVIPGGVDPARFHPGLREVHRAEVRCELGLSEYELAVLFVASGNFINRGLLNLFSALRRGPDFPMKLIVAGGDRVGPYQSLAKKMGIERRLIFLPFTDRPERLHAAADGLIFPSYYDAFGNVPLEAMASGLPVIVSARCGVSELITDGRDGLILKSADDGAEIAEALSRLADPELRERLGREARATAERHTWDAAAERTMRVYEEIVS